jgi:hypothetical protein
MTVMANHHVLRFKISVNVTCMMKHLQRGKHLVANESNSFDAEFFLLFVENFVNTFLKLLHYEVRVGCKGFETKYNRKFLSLGKFSQNLELFFDQDSFLQI